MGVHSVVHARCCVSRIHDGDEIRNLTEQIELCEQSNPTLVYITGESQAMARSTFKMLALTRAGFCVRELKI